MNKIKLHWNKICTFVNRILKDDDMASIIKITPTLRGRNAINFYKRIRSNGRVDSNKVRIIKNDAQKLRAILKQQ